MRAVALVVLAGAMLGACGSSGAERARPVAAAPAPPKTLQVNAPGAPVDVPGLLPAGYVTVVDFWSESCEPCATFGAMLETGVADEPRVVIRKIDVGDGLTAVARDNHIASLPRFFIYDKQKRLRYDLLGGDCEKASSFAKQLAAE
jgi:thiol-disulfide isomerase/thioredoxin